MARGHKICVKCEMPITKEPCMWCGWKKKKITETFDEE